MDNVDLVEILDMIYKKLIKEVRYAYYNKTLDFVLKKYGFIDKVEHYYYDRNNSKIIVLGDSRVSKDDLMNCAKGYGFSSDQIEFVFEYDKLTNFDFSKFRNNVTYSDILVGPMHHKWTKDNEAVFYNGIAWN